MINEETVMLRNILLLVYIISIVINILRLILILVDHKIWPFMLNIFLLLADIFALLATMGFSITSLKINIIIKTFISSLATY